MQDGFGAWKDGAHVVGARNMRMEKELYGEVGDGQHQVSHGGIKTVHYRLLIILY